MSNLNKKETMLAAVFLDQLSEKMGSSCCNDWEFPEDWSIDEKKLFVKEFHDWNGDPEEYDENCLSLPDFCVAGFLSEKLKGWK